MPDGDDVNSMYLKYGVEYFQQKIGSVVDVVS
jgi:hypothetical protein